MAKNFKELIIPKDAAVFRLDGNGCWHNEHGKFRNKKIIDFFHSAIKKDRQGYYVGQIREHLYEKVYFHYDETALFVFDIVKETDIILLLNTGRKIKLKPRNLLIKDDSLYMSSGEDLIKFAERSLMKIFDLLEFEGDQYFIKVKNRRYKIASQIS